MNSEQVAQLLATMIPYDQRTVGHTDVIAWQGAIGDLRFRECQDAVVAHYQDSNERVMPADIRARVARYRHAAAGEERQQEIEAHAAPGSQELVPMPDWFRSTVAEHLKRSRVARFESDGPVTFGSAILTALDSMPRGGPR